EGFFFYRQNKILPMVTVEPGPAGCGENGGNDDAIDTSAPLSTEAGNQGPFYMDGKIVLHFHFTFILVLH
ncbi:MAG TPA: hypothetical protein VLR49_00610, partial [Ferruginibacter sp.]|nr:hypothetical protein [Ferruginibacter sp.]